MAMHDEIKEQTLKFKDMSLKKKAGYIWDYYKWWIIGGIIFIIAAFSFISQWRISSRPVYLQAYFLNSNLIYDPDSTIMQDYIDMYNIDTDAYNLYIDTGSYIDPDGYDQVSMGNQMKLMASYYAGDIDVLAGPKILIDGYANADAYADLMEILPESLIEELDAKGYETYTCKNEDGRSFIAGIYLDNCSYLKEQGEGGVYPESSSDDERPVFTIAANSQNQDHAIELLEMLIK